MRYVEKTLAPGERIVAHARLHRFAWLRAWAALVLLGIVLWGVYFFVKEAARLLSTEIAVTSRRVIRKTGLFTRHVIDIELSTVEAVGLEQSMLGRMLGYGCITVHGTGDDSLETPAIARPLAFRREIETAMIVMRDEPVRHQTTQLAGAA
ncbi:MAG: PH domain-containing protein [Hyphomonadaceae bacterium]